MIDRLPVPLSARARFVEIVDFPSFSATLVISTRLYPFCSSLNLRFSANFLLLSSKAKLQVGELISTDFLEGWIRERKVFAFLSWLITPKQSPSSSS